MTYFSKFPLYYTRTADGKSIVLTDLFRRIKVTQRFGDINVGLTPYLVLDGETPEMISNLVYGTPYYHWVILHVNNIVNVYTEWPLEGQALVEKIVRDYPDINGVHHYQDSVTGLTVDYPNTKDYVFPVAVSNMDYEIALNDAKRIIRLLDPDNIQTFVHNFENMIGS
jgi:hypothetical protein